MNIHSLEVRSFRNITAADFAPEPGVNVIFGENAQGKTNLLEAIWLFTGFRSFRGTKDRELVQFGQESARLKMEFNNDVRDQTAELYIGEKKKAKLGGVELESAGKLCEAFQAVIFSPVHLELVRGGPQRRRNFLNQALCQLKPNYAARLSQFNRILLQRNSLLKDLPFHSELLETLEVWDERFAKFAAYLTLQRQGYVAELDKSLERFYEGLSGGKEHIQISYETGVTLQETDLNKRAEEIISVLKENRNADIQTGFTTFGPHRDEISILLNSVPLKTFGSQGQQRSCALSMKMAEAAVLEQKTGKNPIILLDDVMSELDGSRQDYILNHIEGWQVFMTCCEPSEILRQKTASGKLFEMKEGNLCSSI